MSHTSRRVGPSNRIAAVIVSSLLLVACGSGSDGSEPDDPAADVATTDTEPEPSDDGFELPANVWPAEVDDPAAGADGESGVDGFELPANVWPAEVDDPVDGVEDAMSKDVVTRSVGDDIAGVSPVGVTTVTARITSKHGDVCDVCLWLADSSVERSTGLMGVTDLGGPVGMAFVWGDATDGRFFMLDTPTPLSIAWFAESGEHVGQADMAPCLTDDSGECERYGPDAPYTLAVEMFQGQFDVVGIEPGSTVELVAGTESATCLLDA